MIKFKKKIRIASKNDRSNSGIHSLNWITESQNGETFGSNWSRWQHFSIEAKSTFRPCFLKTKPNFIDLFLVCFSVTIEKQTIHPNFTLENISSITLMIKKWLHIYFVVKYIEQLHRNLLPFIYVKNSILMLTPILLQYIQLIAPSLELMIPKVIAKKKKWWKTTKKNYNKYWSTTKTTSRKEATTKQHQNKKPTGMNMKINNKNKITREKKNTFSNK